MWVVRGEMRWGIQVDDHRHDRPGDVVTRMEMRQGIQVDYH
jgi:hypothetical protein